MEPGFYVVNTTFANPLKDRRSKDWYKREEIQKGWTLFIANKSTSYYRIYHVEAKRSQFILVNAENDLDSKEAEFLRLLQENTFKIEEDVNLAMFRASVYNYVNPEEILSYLAEMGRINVEDINNAIKFFEGESNEDRVA